jgi:hypothetical protein
MPHTQTPPIQGSTNPQAAEQQAHHRRPAPQSTRIAHWHQPTHEPTTLKYTLTTRAKQVGPHGTVASVSLKDAIKHKAAFNDQGEATAMYGHASSTPLLPTRTLHFHLHNSLHIPLLASSLRPSSPSHPDYGSQAPDACDNDSNVTSNARNNNSRSPSACTNGPRLTPLTVRGRVGSTLTTRLRR